MELKIKENGKLKKISAIFFLISALFSVFCVRIMPMPTSGLKTDFSFLPSADKSVFYNSIFLNPASLLWGLALIVCSILIIMRTKRSYTIISGIIFVFSAFALAIPMVSASYDDCFMAVILQSAALCISSLFLFLALTRPRFRVLPCRIFIGISEALILYSIYECLTYKYLLMVSDAIAVVLINSSLMLMAFMLEKKKKDVEEYDYE